MPCSKYKWRVKCTKNSIGTEKVGIVEMVGERTTDIDSVYCKEKDAKESQLRTKQQIKGPQNKTVKIYCSLLPVPGVVIARRHHRRARGAKIHLIECPL